MNPTVADLQSALGQAFEEIIVKEWQSAHPESVTSFGDPRLSNEHANFQNAPATNPARSHP